MTKAVARRGGILLNIADVAARECKNSVLMWRLGEAGFCLAVF